MAPIFRIAISFRTLPSCKKNTCPAIVIAPAEKPQSDRVTDPAGSDRNSAQPGGAKTGLRILLLSIVFLLLGAIGGFSYRGHIDEKDVIDSAQRVLEFRTENDKLKAQIFNLNTKIEQMHAEARALHNSMEAMQPAANSYVIGVNKSMVVAEGHLTVGLIGSPTSENLKINVNGREYLAAAGDNIEVFPDPSTKCQVSVQSFDMFRAIVVASCQAAKR